MGTANISNNKNKTKTFFVFLSCFFSQKFLNMILFFKKYNKEIITFLIWEHYLTTYSLGQLVWKCLKWKKKKKKDTKLSILYFKTQIATIIS